MLRLNRARISALAVGSLLVGMGATGAYAEGVPSPDSTVVDDGDWYTQAYENTDTGEYTVPEQADVTGPQRAPFGTGSHKMSVGQFEVQTELYRTNVYDGVDLGELTRLEYSTYARHTAGGDDRQPPYLRLSVDEDADGLLDTSLFFFPANNGTIVNGEWQNWDVTGGLLNVDGDSGAGEISLADYAAAHQNAVLVNDPYDPAYDAGAVSLIAGAANTMTRGEYFVDRVIVGHGAVDTLYDFGPNDETDGGVTEVTVDPAHSQGWGHQAYNNTDYLASNQEFVTGPGSPPLGDGSLKMSLDSEEDDARVELFRTAQYDGTLIRDLRTITYSTYSQANGGNDTPQQPAYMRLSVDTDGDGATDDTLYYYPANNGAPLQNTWQTWDAGNGVWGVNGDQGPQNAVTLADYAVAHPDATIVENADTSETPGADEQPTGGVAFLVGGGGDGQMDGEYFLDAITISHVDAATGSLDSGEEFDLEPTAAAGGGGGGGDLTEPTVSIGDARVTEGDSGTTNLSFPVTVTNPTDQPVTVQYATSNGSATAGSDYTARSGDLTIPAGQSTGQIIVQVLSDTVQESDETMTVTLTSPGYGTLGDGSATGTILDDDAPSVTPRKDINLKLTGYHNGGKADRPKANAKSNAGGLVVKLFKRADGRLKLVKKATLNTYGNHKFKVADKNGRAKTKYVVKVAKTKTTYADRAVKSIR